ncbi:GNAT family N-acetyltransferase [Winogradskyella bathintestinalis]|uniref:GNAT family N-acetyltransferase n=1 Tax=Winogradskyella bathintestinalis TaxID=3035208 RepID=UPI0025B605F4|nr:GNAT family N-acetyltransferase [Winogradskyella bathintestinalis]
MSNIELNRSDEVSVKDHLNKCDVYFKPKLSSYVDIDMYSKKLIKSANRLEVWDGSYLIALLAYYKKEDKIYISNLSVDYNYFGNSIGFNLLTYLIGKYKKMNILNISLEVFKENKKALKFYKLNDFYIINQDDNKFLLNYDYV